MKRVFMKARIHGFQAVCGMFLGAFILTGCFDRAEEEKVKVNETETDLVLTETETEGDCESIAVEPEIRYADWSEYFDGLNGAAVVYHASEMQYTIYNNELALTRRSPCSTFKIISSLIALEHGIIELDDSVHTWSGEVF